MVPTDTPETPTATPTACTLQFTDVPPSSTFYNFIHCLVCLGIINGYPDHTFKPNASVTRGQLSKIVSNSAGFDDTPTGQQFQDVPASGPGSTFYVYIYRLVHRGFINGYPCGGTGEPCVPPANLPYFRPNANATRGQISKIVSNASQLQRPADRAAVRGRSTRLDILHLHVQAGGAQCDVRLCVRRARRAVRTARQQALLQAEQQRHEGTDSQDR